MMFRSHQQFLRGSGWETGRDAKYMKNWVNMFEGPQIQEISSPGKSITFDASKDSSFIEISKNFLRGYFPDLTDDQLVDVLVDPDRIPKLLAERGYDDEEIKRCFPGQMAKSEMSSTMNQMIGNSNSMKKDFEKPLLTAKGFGPLSYSGLPMNANFSGFRSPKLEDAMNDYMHKSQEYHKAWRPLIADLTAKSEQIAEAHNEWFQYKDNNEFFYEKNNSVTLFLKRAEFLKNFDIQQYDLIDDYKEKAAAFKTANDKLTVLCINGTSGILGDILLNKDGLGYNFEEFYALQKRDLIVKKCVNIYKQYMELLNTDPHWGMEHHAQSCWELNDLCTDDYIKIFLRDYLNPKLKKTVINDVMIAGFDLNSLEAYNDVKEPTIESINLVALGDESEKSNKFFIIELRIPTFRRNALYDRFGNLVRGDPEKWLEQTELVQFEIPVTIYNSATTRYRISDLTHFVPFGDPLEFYQGRNTWQGKDVKENKGTQIVSLTESAESINAKNYEKELIFKQDRQQMRQSYGDNLQGDHTLHNTININFPEREDIAWTQKRQAQASDEHYDHRGSPMTSGLPGYQGYADVKKSFRRWFWRAIGPRTHMNGGGKGNRPLYMARWLRGSVGSYYDMYFTQLIGRKRLAVFNKRLAGKISLPKPAASFIAQPPTNPIGWNVEVLGDWRENEPFAMYPGRWQKTYSEKDLGREHRKKDLGDKNYDKYGPHSQISKPKFEKMPKEAAEKIKWTKKPAEKEYVGHDVSHIVNSKEAVVKKDDDKE